MTKLNTARLKTLARQLTQGVIGEIEFVAALRVPESISLQLDQALTLPPAAHRRIKIEDFDWPKQDAKPDPDGYDEGWDDEGDTVFGSLPGPTAPAKLPTLSAQGEQTQMEYSTKWSLALNDADLTNTTSDHDKVLRVREPIGETYAFRIPQKHHAQAFVDFLRLRKCGPLHKITPIRGGYSVCVCASELRQLDLLPPEMAFK